MLLAAGFTVASLTAAAGPGWALESRPDAPQFGEAPQSAHAASGTEQIAASAASHRRAILILTNRARASAGCSGVRYSTQLQRSAQAHADDMARHNYLSHTSRSGRDFDRRIRATGYRGNWTGENIGRDFSSPEAVFRAWMRSPSHRRIILTCGFRALGVGFNPRGDYWVQHFVA